jgi:Domain of unknown function (DUF1508)
MPVSVADPSASGSRLPICGPGRRVVTTRSETYERKQPALSGIESVKQSAPAAAVDDQTGD